MTTPRRLALVALARIREGAYANLVLPPMLARSDLDERDRRFTTELVYGTTRMARACDFLVDRFLFRDVDPPVRDALRLGAYQLAFLGTPAHAALDATVAEVRGRARGLVNAVLRKTAAAVEGVEWPDDATRLSYPDWIVERLVDDLGRDDAIAALERMNAPAAVHERPDGYVQDPASQVVARYVDAQEGDRVLDLCAAPGGKATLLAAAGSGASVVVAADVQPARAGLISANATRTGVASTVATVVADGRRAPLRARSFDRVLVDAPCSGLGVLRRRADARWRVQPSDVDDLVALQRALLDAAVALVRPGGRFVYSVCTLTRAEGPGNGAWFLGAHPELEPAEPPPPPWRPCDGGAILLPHDADTDGMYVLGASLRGNLTPV